MSNRGSGGVGVMVPGGTVIWVVLATLGLVAVAAGTYFTLRSSLPAPGSQPYEQVTRAFYRGLAALDVGLLDDARDQFASATTTVPEEPAAWANLALARLRLGDTEGAAPAIERALTLAPNRADILLLASRLESARGQLDPSVALLRRAVAADPSNLRARFALVEELERAGQGDAGDEVPRLLDDLIAQAPSNLAVVVERARVAARRSDVARAQDSVSRLDALSVGWPDIALEQLAGLRRTVAAGQWPDAVRSAALLRNVLARVPAFSESLSQVRTPAELVSQPLTTFVALTSPVARPVSARRGAVVHAGADPRAGGRRRVAHALCHRRRADAGARRGHRVATLRRIGDAACHVAGGHGRPRRGRLGLEPRLQVRRRRVRLARPAAVRPGRERCVCRPDAGFRARRSD